jgi:hypothetical protein
MSVNFISLLEVDEHNCWFQQVGTMAPVSSTVQILSELFVGRIIS